MIHGQHTRFGSRIDHLDSCKGACLGGKVRYIMVLHNAQRYCAVYRAYREATKVINNTKLGYNLETISSSK